MQNFLGIYLAEIGNFLKRVYPPFVTAVRPISLGEGVPVFVFHGVRDEQFSEQLEFLARNNYHTLTADELFDFVLKGKKTPEKSIVLTFDDGERSLYTVAFPLLKKFGFKAASFIVPSFIREGQDYEQSGKQWLSWSEVNEMERSGFIDFQSHTLEHEKMFISDEIVDFYHPNLFVDELGLDVPTVLSDENYCKLAGFGAPVYRMGSRMDSSLRYFDDERLRRDCIEYVENHGGVSFFKHKGWRQKLGHLFRKLQEDRGSAGYFESRPQQVEAISGSLEKSKEILEERLDKEISHLAYPWGYGSELSLTLSKEAGYKTNFWGPLRGVRINSAGGNPYYISRLKDDYLFRLPGKGRKPLIEIFKFKLIRRMKMRDIY